MAVKKGYVGTYWISPREEACLIKLLKTTSVKNFLEIGTFHGIIIADLAKHFPNIQFDTIDPFTKAHMTEGGSKDFFLENIRRAGVRNVRLFEMTSSQAAGVTRSDYGVIFIDGAHSYEVCYGDLKNYLPKLLPNGYCLIHDYGWIPGVNKAVKIFLENEKDVSVIDRIDGSILIRKSKPKINNFLKLDILFVKELPIRVARKILTIAKRYLNKLI